LGQLPTAGESSTRWIQTTKNTHVKFQKKTKALWAWFQRGKKNQAARKKSTSEAHTERRPAAPVKKSGGNGAMLSL